MTLIPRPEIMEMKNAPRTLVFSRVDLPVAVHAKLVKLAEKNFRSLRKECLMALTTWVESHQDELDQETKKEE